MPIAAIVITKDEERNIGDCLQSLRWADEIIVVDACSTDRTVDIAKRYRSRVFVRPWPGYGPQKNFGIEQSATEWVLVVDADERVTASLQEEIQKVIGADVSTVVGYEIPRRNYFYGQWIRGGGMYPDYQLRLFRKAAGSYDAVALHERLHLDGKIARLEFPLEHFSMPSIHDHVLKMMSYTTLGAKEKLKARSRISMLDVGGSHLATVLRTYVFRGGYRDGIRGMIIALFSGMFTFVKYAKAWEMLQTKTYHREVE